MNDDSSRPAIEGLFRAIETAWNAHDSAAYGACFHEDADFTNLFGVSIRGRAAIAAVHAQIFETMFRDSHLTIETIATRLLRPDVASVEVRWRMTGARDHAGAEWPDRYGLLSGVVTREADAWRIAVFHNQDLPSPERLAEIVRAP